MKRLIAAALVAAALPVFAQAPAWPSHPVKFVNNFPAGGPADLIARSVADALHEQLNQPFIVDNKASAGGNMGADAVAKAAADGYTVAEAGLPQLEQEVLYLAMVPAATPEPVVQALQKAIVDALARPEVRARLEQLDLHHEGITGAAAAKRLADLSARYGKVITATGMKVE